MNPAVEGTVIDETDFNALVQDVEDGFTESTYTAGLGSTDNLLVRTDGTDGKKVQATGIAVDDSDNVTGVAAIAATTIELGHASDTTLARSGAGDITVEGNAVYRAGGTDVPVADGGTGASTATAGFDNLAPTTTQGDLIYHNGTNNARLATGTSGQVLTSQGPGADPIWSSTSGTGDVVGPASSVDGEIVLFDSTTGKLLKSATTTGVLKATSGVISAAVSATDYAPATSGSAILKGDGAGGFSAAVSATDYAPATTGSAILKGDGAGGFSAAVSATDYAPATSGSAILKGDGAGGFGAASAGTDYYAPGSTDVALADGGTGSSLGDPGSDQIMFWDDSAGEVTWLTVGTGLSISATTLTATASAPEIIGIVNGRLTLTTGTPITTSAVTAATTLYFTPYCGGQIALYDGSTSWSLFDLTEISASLSGLTADTNYDVFVYDNTGLTLDLVAWSTATARATALTTQDGVYVKSGATTRRYVGTIRITGTTGQCEDSLGGSNSIAKRFVWNYYNRVPRQAYVIESTSSWTYSTGTWRRMNANTNMQVQFVVGVDEYPVDIVGVQSVKSLGTPNVGVTLDWSSGEPNTQGAWGFAAGESGSAVTAGIYGLGSSRLLAFPGIGYHTADILERGTTSCTFYGRAANSWNCGITATIWG